MCCSMPSRTVHTVVAKRSVTNQRQSKALIAENTRLKRQVRQLQDSLLKYGKWEGRIANAVERGDNLRALALFKGERPHEQEKDYG